ncbi:Hypothetical protein A7982_11398 [Minicystis rosea]|nr:Hypothetical protein A7982_11398 [Minicystis rosea]
MRLVIRAGSSGAGFGAACGPIVMAILSGARRPTTSRPAG